MKFYLASNSLSDSEEVTPDFPAPASKFSFAHVHEASRQLHLAEVVYKTESNPQLFRLGPRRQQSKQDHFGVYSLIN